MKARTILLQLAWLIPMLSQPGVTDSLYEPGPAWVSSLALRAVQGTAGSDIRAEDLRMYRTGRMAPHQPAQVQYVFSPDGKAVLLRTRGKQKDSEILWLGKQGEDSPSRLFEARWGTSGPRWSPDGKKVAFIVRLISTVDMTFIRRPEEDVKAYTLVVADIESGATKEVTPRWYYAGSGFYAFDWSPDGGSIAFTASMVPMSDERDSLELYLADVASATPSIVRLTDNDVLDEMPVFSPEGDRIAFRRRVPLHAYDQVWILDLASGSEKLIAGGQRREGSGWYLSAGGHIEWWPDGTGVNFSAA